MTTSSSATEMFGWVSRMDFGASLTCFKATDTLVSPSKGTLPVSISYITTPTEYRSLFSSAISPLACSGEK